jgi:hypothetical protein
MIKCNLKSTTRGFASCFFASIATVIVAVRCGATVAASTRSFPIIARRENIAPPDAKTLALPAGNLAVARNARRELRLDLDGDGRTERLAIDARRDPTIAIWRGKRLIARGARRSWGAWKLTTGDVDGDGLREILLGVNKTTRSLPFKHNALFVMGFDGHKIYRKWLGSSLAKPFDDFLVADIDGDKRDELISLETLPNSRRCIAVYSWSGFGFSMDFQRGNWKTARLLSATRARVLAHAEGRRIEVKMP